MPPGMLGAMTMAGLGAVFLLRRYMIKQSVDSLPLLEQAKRTFIVEYSVFLLAGVLVILLNQMVYSVPLLSGIVYFFGFLAFGFFIAIDMSLAKERRVIEQSTLNVEDVLESRHFYPLTRKFFIVAVVTNLLVMVIIMLIVGRDLSWLAGIEPDQMNLMIGATAKMIFKEILFVIAILLLQTINILYSYSKNLSLLFQKETTVLESVTRGDLSSLVPVATRDEFGVIATNTNQMIHGLRDRIRLLSRLSVAKEVQENLLPGRPPDIDNLDIAGTSIYCEEVGGDYYDYFQLDDNKVGIILTDCSGHGVGAGLHMATIRAFLKYGVRHYQGPAQLIASVNRHLTRDSGGSGRFTTAFFAEVNLDNFSMRWVRAGHEPAFLFTPGTNKCEKLIGKGMALGVDAEADIHENLIEDVEKGSVLVIYSDGIKESRNAQQQMYGEKRIIDLIEKNAVLSASDLLVRITEDLKQFTGEHPIEDDITLVIIKFL
jgi:sigma-B regulation protein RsbU (phosphoserine phosphatase)